MNIKMFEVNFGEAILYQEDTNKVLVDCGAKYYNKGKLAYDRIKNEIDQNTKLIITHFDEDHYNGIIEIPDSYHFDEIVLPLYIYENGKQSNTMDLFIDTLYVWTYMMAFGKKKKINSFHKLFLKLPKLVDSIHDIHCVGKGDRVFAGSKEFQVLWPQESCDIKSTFYKREISDILKSMTDDETLEMFMTAADKYVSSLIKIYRFFCNNGRDRQYSDVNNIDIYEELQNLESLYDSLDKIQLNIKLDEHGKNRVNSISSLKIRNMNECSIVFKIENEVIAFGDVSARIIKYLKKNKYFNDEYKIIKVQHHGTKNYWSNDIPRAKKYLVSNSGNKNINWAIYGKYGEIYNEKMLCTNDDKDRCVFLKNGKSCVNCNEGKGKVQFIIDTNTL